MASGERLPVGVKNTLKVKKDEKLLPNKAYTNLKNRKRPEQNQKNTINPPNSAPTEQFYIDYLDDALAQLKKIDDTLPNITRKDIFESRSIDEMNRLVQQEIDANIKRNENTDITFRMMEKFIIETLKTGDEVKDAYLRKLFKKKNAHEEKFKQWYETVNLEEISGILHPRTETTVDPIKRNATCVRTFAEYKKYIEESSQLWDKINVHMSEVLKMATKPPPGKNPSAYMADIIISHYDVKEEEKVERMDVNGKLSMYAQACASTTVDSYINERFAEQSIIDQHKLLGSKTFGNKVSPSILDKICNHFSSTQRSSIFSGTHFAYMDAVTQEIYYKKCVAAQRETGAFFKEFKKAREVFELLSKYSDDFAKQDNQFEKKNHIKEITKSMNEWIKQRNEYTLLDRERIKFLEIQNFDFDFTPTGVDTEANEMFSLIYYMISFLAFTIYMNDLDYIEDMYVTTVYGGIELESPDENTFKEREWMKVELYQKAELYKHQLTVDKTFFEMELSNFFTAAHSDKEWNDISGEILKKELKPILKTDKDMNAREMLKYLMLTHLDLQRDDFEGPPEEKPKFLSILIQLLQNYKRFQIIAESYEGLATKYEGSQFFKKGQKWNTPTPKMSEFGLLFEDKFKQFLFALGHVVKTVTGLQKPMQKTNFKEEALKETDALLTYEYGKISEILGENLIFMDENLPLTNREILMRSESRKIQFAIYNKQRHIYKASIQKITRDFNNVFSDLNSNLGKQTISIRSMTVFTIKAMAIAASIVTVPLLALIGTTSSAFTLTTVSVTTMYIYRGGNPLFDLGVFLYNLFSRIIPILGRIEMSEVTRVLARKTNDSKDSLKGMIEELKSLQLKQFGYGSDTKNIMELMTNFMFFHSLYDVDNKGGTTIEFFAAKDGQLTSLEKKLFLYLDYYVAINFGKINSPTPKTHYMFLILLFVVLLGGVYAFHAYYNPNSEPFRSETLYKFVSDFLKNTGASELKNKILEYFPASSLSGFFGKLFGDSTSDESKLETKYPLNPESVRMFQDGEMLGDKMVHKVEFKQKKMSETGKLYTQDELKDDFNKCYDMFGHYNNQGCGTLNSEEKDQVTACANILTFGELYASKKSFEKSSDKLTKMNDVLLSVCSNEGSSPEEKLVKKQKVDEYLNGSLNAAKNILDGKEVYNNLDSSLQLGSFNRSVRQMVATITKGIENIESMFGWGLTKPFIKVGRAATTVYTTAKDLIDALKDAKTPSEATGVLYKYVKEKQSETKFYALLAEDNVITEQNFDALGVRLSPSEKKHFASVVNELTPEKRIYISSIGINSGLVGLKPTMEPEDIQTYDEIRDFPYKLANAQSIPAIMQVAYDTEKAIGKYYGEALVLENNILQMFEYAQSAVSFLNKKDYFTKLEQIKHEYEKQLHTYNSESVLNSLNLNRQEIQNSVVSSTLQVVGGALLNCKDYTEAKGYLKKIIESLTNIMKIKELTHKIKLYQNQLDVTVNNITTLKVMKTIEEKTIWINEETKKNQELQKERDSIIQQLSENEKELKKNEEELKVITKNLEILRKKDDNDTMLKVQEKKTIKKEVDIAIITKSIETLRTTLSVLNDAIQHSNDIIFPESSIIEEMKAQLTPEAQDRLFKGKLEQLHQTMEKKCDNLESILKEYKDKIETLQTDENFDGFPDDKLEYFYKLTTEAKVKIKMYSKLPDKIQATLQNYYNELKGINNNFNNVYTMCKVIKPIFYKNYSGPDLMTIFNALTTVLGNTVEHQFIPIMIKILNPFAQLMLDRFSKKIANFRYDATTRKFSKTFDTTKEGLITATETASTISAWYILYDGIGKLRRLASIFSVAQVLNLKNILNFLILIMKAGKATSDLAKRFIDWLHYRFCGIKNTQFELFKESVKFMEEVNPDEPRLQHLRNMKNTLDPSKFPCNILRSSYTGFTKIEFLLAELLAKLTDPIVHGIIAITDAVIALATETCQWFLNAVTAFGPVAWFATGTVAVFGAWFMIYTMPTMIQQVPRETYICLGKMIQGPTNTLGGIGVTLLKNATWQSLRALTIHFHLNAYGTQMIANRGKSSIYHTPGLLKSGILTFAYYAYPIMDQFKADEIYRLF